MSETKEQQQMSYTLLRSGYRLLLNDTKKNMRRLFTVHWKCFLKENYTDLFLSILSISLTGKCLRIVVFYTIVRIL